MSMSEQVLVPMGFWRVESPPAVLTVLGLGSCVCVIAHDPMVRLAGLAHILLPDSDLAHGSRDSARFADVGLTLMISELAERGARPPHLGVHLVGGARMIDAAAPNRAIGPRNVAAVKAFLSTLSVRILSEDTGGKRARTVFFDVATGSLTVRTL